MTEAGVGCTRLARDKLGAIEVDEGNPVLAELARETKKHRAPAPRGTSRKIAAYCSVSRLIAVYCGLLQYIAP
jgi:hypothetical protein